MISLDIKREVFYFFTGLGLVSIVMEIVWPGIIVSYFNLNWLFIAWFVTALSVLSINK